MVPTTGGPTTGGPTVGGPTTGGPTTGGPIVKPPHSIGGKPPHGIGAPVTPPVTEPTPPVTEPTPPVTEPTDPVTEPTDPVTEPTDPVTEPTDRPTDPAGPATGPWIAYWHHHYNFPGAGWGPRTGDPGTHLIKRGQGWQHGWRSRHHDRDNGSHQGPGHGRGGRR